MDFLQNKNVKTFFYVLGLLWAAGKAFKILRAFYRTFIRRKRDLAARYGANSYAFVTGASDGIGKEFCRQLALKNFNIILLARNQKKLEEAAADIKKVNPKIDVRIVAADLSKSYQDGFFDEIYNQVKDLDISILINNAGVDCYDKFLDLDAEQLKNMIYINCLPPVLLTKKLLPKIQARPKKGGVINVSSGAAIVPLAYYSTYTGTKALVDMFTRSIADEFPDIDIMSLKPFDVSTKMIYNREPDIMTITIEECVRGALNDFGHQDGTYGHWKHKLQGALYEFVPRWLFNYVYFKLVAPDFFKEREEGRKKELEQAAKKTQ